MLAREQTPRNQPSLSVEVKEAKQTLKAKGWSYRNAAPHLGVHWTHLARVLTGVRESQALLKRIHALPPYRKIELLTKAA